MARSPFTGFATLCLTIGLIASFAVSPASAGAGGTVVVPRGQPLQLAFTASTAELGGLSSAIENAVRMAIERHPTVRGFPVQLNAVETPCEGDSTASATAIVANTQNTAVIGNLCSAGFVSALPIYEAAGVVVVSGSATADFLPGAAESTVFNRTIVRDGDGAAAWMAQVATLPSVQAWNQAYRAEFGTPAPDLAPFYADAASLLLDQLERGSKVVHGNLVVDRADLAAAVRDTIRFKGVTCAIALDPATGNRVNDPRALAHCANYQPVVVQPGQPVQIAFANDLTGFASAFGSNFSHAVQMAVEAHPTVRGFPIQVNTVDSPCGDPGANVAAARLIASNLQNVAVLGQLCSAGFDQALPVYQAAGLVTLSGSATGDNLSSSGYYAFNRTVVSDADGGNAWYSTVSTLPSELRWRQRYADAFGAAPMPLADLYYDAATLLIRDLKRASHVEHGSLVIDRTSLMDLVRSTRNAEGVSCTITLGAATGSRVNDPAALQRCAAEGSSETEDEEGETARRRR